MKIKACFSVHSTLNNIVQIAAIFSTFQDSKTSSSCGQFDIKNRNGFSRVFDVQQRETSNNNERQSAEFGGANFRVFPSTCTLPINRRAGN